MSTTKKKAERPTIGLLSDDLLYSIPKDIFNGADAAAREKDANLLLFACDQQRVKNLGRLVSSEIVDALLIASNLLAADADRYGGLQTFCHYYDPLPLVSLGLAIEGIPSIIAEDRYGMYDLISHLIDEHGKSRIAFINGPENHPATRERIDAYKKALSDHGLAIDPALILPGSFTDASAAAAVRLLLEERLKKPGRTVDAVVAANDYMARGAMLELQARGYRIPEDIAIGGFDDVLPAHCIAPPISSVYVPFREMGHKGLDLLLSRLKGKKTDEKNILHSQLRVRHSCGCPDKEEEEFFRHKNMPEEIMAAITRSPQAFIKQLNQLIMSRGVTSLDLFVWEGLLAELRRFAWKSALLSGNDGASTRVWREMASSVYLDFSHKDLVGKATTLGISLSSTTNVAEISNILARGLPTLGITDCFLVLYDNALTSGKAEKIPDRSRLLLACREGERLDLPSGGRLFPTRQLMPPEYLPKDKRWTYVLEALYSQEELIGHVLFNAVTEEKRIYAELSRLISGSLEGSQLVRRLQSANEKIKVLNKKLKRENVKMQAEMEVARRIQDTLLPLEHELRHPDFEIAACMRPAEEVGGDYYDVSLDRNNTLWLGIGDVSGHGVTPGLIMMMAQTIHTTIAANYSPSPRDLIIMLNRVIYRNVHHRMAQPNYMTFTTLKYLGDGGFQYAGLHLDMILYRKSKHACETIETGGTWLNLMPDIDEFITNTELKMELGDVLCLYTDGLVEAFNDRRQMLGPERLQNLVLSHADKKMSELREGVIREVQAWCDGNQNDDMTLLALRRIK